MYGSLSEMSAERDYGGKSTWYCVMCGVCVSRSAHTGRRKCSRNVPAARSSMKIFDMASMQRSQTVCPDVVSISSFFPIPLEKFLPTNRVNKVKKLLSILLLQFFSQSALLKVASIRVSFFLLSLSVVHFAKRILWPSCFFLFFSQLTVGNC